MKKYRKLLNFYFIFGVFWGSAFLHGEGERRVPIESIQSKDIPDDYAFSTSKCDKLGLHSALIKDLYGCAKL